MARELSEDEEDAQQLKLGGEFQRSQCLLHAEVIDVLEHRQQIFEDNATTPVLDKSLEYAKRFRKYNNREAAAEVRKALTSRGLKQFEICAVGNLCPVSVAEAKALQWSLADPNQKDNNKKPRVLEDDDIEMMLNEITNVRRFNN